jgi:hypothetical protein
VAMALGESETGGGGLGRGGVAAWVDGRGRRTHRRNGPPSPGRSIRADVWGMSNRSACRAGWRRRDEDLFGWKLRNR